MNECCFFLHTAILIGLILIARRFGKTALSLLCTLFFLLANLFVIKQVELFSFTVTAADAYTIGGIFALNLLQENFGKEEAKKQSLLSAFILLSFALLSQIHLLYLPSIQDQTHSAFSTIFSTSPRIFLASFCVFFLMQRLDIRLFSLFRNRLSLPLTMLFSATISQFVDTVLFSYAALYGLVYSIFDIIFVSYCMKLLALLCMTPFAKLARKTA
jgi:uncharacterized integral membrane protein (TIGR00697 family)